MTAEQFNSGLQDKLLGQVRLALLGQRWLRDGGSITLTSGVAATEPIRHGANASTVNAALHGFVTGAAVELQRGLRINAVSPTLLTESADAYGSVFPGFETVPAARVALAYQRSVEGARPAGSSRCSDLFLRRALGKVLACPPKGPRATLRATMFNPTQADVRRFFCGVRTKMLSGAPMEAIETLASLWIAEHPEYFDDLADVDAALLRDYDATPGVTNPFCICPCICPSASSAASTSRAAYARPWSCSAAAWTRCTTPTTPPWNAWGRCSGKASVRAARPMAKPISPQSSAAPRVTVPRPRAAHSASVHHPQDKARDCGLLLWGMGLRAIHCDLWPRRKWGCGRVCSSPSRLPM